LPALFDAVQRAGGVHPDEMWRTFNMGIGMAVVVPEADAGVVSEAAGLPVYQIGRVVEQAAPERVVLR
jgi:phosphoribosylformylglycinamidine cyclo-ligase